MSSKVPQDVLNSSAEERIEYFRHLNPIAHPKLEAVYREAKWLIARRRTPWVLAIFGASGIGKTTLYRKLVTDFELERAKEIESNPGGIAVIAVEARAPEYGIFKWKPLNKQIMEIGGQPPELMDQILPRLSKRPTADDLSDAVEKMIAHRKPAAVLIDEAQNLAKKAAGRNLQDTLDKIKSMANLTLTPHVLFGSYQLLHFRNLNGQLSRRAKSIHFERYRLDHDSARKNEADKETFLRILKAFEERLPLRKPNDLPSQWKHYYCYTAGCVGVLYELLFAAVELVLTNSDEVISKKALQRCALELESCKTVAKEAKAGEKMLEQSQITEEELAAYLGIDLNDKQPDPPPMRRKKKKPGEPNPQRYPTGTGQE